MKTPPLILLGLIAAPAFALESVLPAAHPASRYETMLERSPFALATPVVAPPPPVASEFSQWYVSGLGRYEDKDYVSIKSRDLGTNFSLFGNEPNADGVQLVGVEWSNERGKSTVTIKKGSEFGKLEFNQAEIATTTAAAPQAVRPGMPQRPGGPPSAGNVPVTNMPVTGGGIAQPRPGGPGAPTNQPRVAIPRPTNAPIPAPPTTITPTGTGSQPPGATSNSDNRRRIRVINPKP